MAKPDDVRRIALALPEAEEQQHHGHPDFRVRKKIFVTLWPDDNRAVVKLPIADQTALVQTNPDTFSLKSWSHKGWTNVDLDAIAQEMLCDVVVNAWRNVAPKRVVNAFDESS